jgi:hypothetical protein
LSDPDGSGFGIFGYTDRIHEIMMGRDDEFKPSQLNDYLSDPDGNGFGIFGYTRGIKEIYEDEYADGGVTFDEKVQSISKSLVERKKVSPSVQKDYGKTYSRKEAIESAKRIAGAMRKKEMSKKK